jgi:hypothetical protein
MSNPDNTYRKGRVSGNVSYVNEKNQRVTIPRGICEISDNNGYGPNFLRWKIGDSTFEVELTLIEFSTYMNSKDFVFLD